MDVSERIKRGELPACLEGGDWLNYAGRGKHDASWDGLIAMWFGVTWVRYQAFERDDNAEMDAISSSGWIEDIAWR